MTDIEVMQQALEALHYGKANKAVTILREALEQPEQEPVAYYHPHKGFYWAKPTHISAPTVVDVPPVPLYVKWKAAQPEQEPVPEKSWVYGTPLLDAMTRDYVPAQRPWQGLTEDEIQELRLKSFDAIATNHEIYRAIEAKLKEKNYG